MIVLPAMVLVFIGAMWLIFAPSSGKEHGLNFRRAFREAGFHISGVCVGVKNSLCLLYTSRCV